MTAKAGRRRAGLAIALALCVVGALGIVFLPIGWQINRFVVWLYFLGRGMGIPEFVSIEWYDFGLNMLLLAVPTVLAGLLWPQVRWWMWPVVALAASIAIEAVQLYFLPREFSVVDIVANTLGALLGAAIPALVHRSRCDEGAIT